jgi:FAD/FMN-containing dehydrogenase
MTAAAGTPMAEIEARLADNHQQLAFEPPDYGALLGGAPGRATIGGVLACNLSGPRRIKAGAARDHFLGVQLVTGRAELIKAGGRVVKNVTGYDLCKLLAGSFGTLAVMTEVTFKVMPRAEASLTVLAAGPDEAQEQCTPVFDGTRLKLVLNSWILCTVENLAETIALARTAGIDPYRFLEGIEGMPFDMAYAHLKGELMLAGDFPAAFPLRLARKDLELAAEAAGGLELPVLRATLAQFRRAVETGHGDEDSSAVYRSVTEA